MIVAAANFPTELESIQRVAQQAFSEGGDADLSLWFSFQEMIEASAAGRGVCLLAKSDDGELLGMAYAQQESPINGNEALQKWVVIIVAVLPSAAGQGIGSALLAGLEAEARNHNAQKMFTYTNQGDEQVINFYRKNGYVDAGFIKDYQYGRDNTAVFLLKYL